MNGTKKLMGVALLTLCGVAIAIPSTTKAVVDDHATNADIEFTRNTGSGGTNTTITKPGETGSTITNITTDIKDPGEFGIVTATPIDFKNNEVLATSREYFAAPFEANPGSTDPNTPNYKIANFVKFRDDRSTLDHKYKLEAKILSNFKTKVNSVEKELLGSQLTFSNLELASIVDPTLRPASSGLASSVVLDGTGNTAEVFKNTDPAKGRGDYEIMFGNEDNGTADRSVRLTVPNSTEIYYNKYAARIQWSLSETP